MQESLENYQKLLQERTKRLARAESNEDSLGERTEIVLFAVGDKSFAIEAKQVKTIQALEQLTFLPGLPQTIAGVTALSGEIYTVLNLEHLLELEETESSKQMAIFLNHSRVKIALLINRVLDYQFISLKNIQKELAAEKPLESPFIKGILKDATLLLDPDKFLEFKLQQ